MARRVKLGKIVIVVFLTALIWIWADLALDETLPDRPAEVVVDELANPKLWVSFNQSPSANVRIELSGPHTAIANEIKRLREGKIREFILNIVQESMNQPGDYDWSLLPFLQKDKQLKQLGLKVKSCEPQVLQVNVVELVKKQLSVECIDENGASLKPESIEPSKIEMFVPADRRTAQVRLTNGEIEHARLYALEIKPYVELSESQPPRYAAEPVKIKMPPAEDVLRPYTITATAGFCLSENLQYKYEVQVLNPSELASVLIKASPAAKSAYEQQPFQIILYILDEDVKKVSEEHRREVVYNFPEEFVRRDEIVLSQPPVPARFRLVELSAEGP
jgi:hypothetical protein